MSQQHHVKRIGLIGWGFLLFLILCVLPMAMAQKETPKVEDEAAEPVEIAEIATKSLDTPFVTIRGKAILPDGAWTSDGNPPTGFFVILSNSEKKERGRGGMHSNPVNADGSFHVYSMPDSDCMIAIFDRDKKWAAPYQFFSVGQSDPEELMFSFEPGVRLEGTLKDKVTGRPIANQQICLIQCREGDENTSPPLPWLTHSAYDGKTDKEGYFSFQVVPKGQFFLTVGPGFYEIVTDEWMQQSEHLMSPEGREEARAKRLELAEYATKVTFADGPVTTVDFNIPSPFYGRVLQSDGSRATNARVRIQNYDNSLKHSYFLETDNGGGFVCVKRPQSVVVQITSNRGDEVYINWFDDDWPQQGRPDFHLRPACTIVGRLTDAKTNEPLKNQLFLYGYSDPNNPARKENFPRFGETDNDGRFTIRSVAAGVCYDLYFIPGLTRVTGDVRHHPYVEIKTLIPENDGETIDLGEIVVDLTQTKEPSTTQPVKNQPSQTGTVESPLQTQAGHVPQTLKIPPTNTEVSDYVWDKFGLRVTPVSQKEFQQRTEGMASPYVFEGAVEVLEVKPGSIFETLKIQKGDMLAAIITPKDPWNIRRVSDLKYLAERWTSDQLGGDEAKIIVVRDKKLLEGKVSVSKSSQQPKPLEDKEVK